MTTKTFFSRILQTVVVFLVFLFLLTISAPSAKAKESQVNYTTSFITEGYPNAINQRGEIVGYRSLEKGKLAWYYSPKTGVINLPLPKGYTYSEAVDISDNGTIIGNIYKDAESFPEAVMWTLSGQKSEFQPKVLDALPIGAGSKAIAINSYDQIVGVSLLDDQISVAFFYDHGIVYNLSDYGFAVTPTDISNTGIIIGDNFWMDITTFDVFILDRPEIPGAKYISSHLMAITDQNQAIGYAEQDNGIINLVLYCPENGWKVVGDISETSRGYRLNQANDQLREMIGVCPETKKGELGPVVYREGTGNVCLSNFLNPKLGNWVLKIAEGNGLNAQGQIVIAATNLDKGFTGTLLLSPVIR